MLEYKKPVVRKLVWWAASCFALAILYAVWRYNTAVEVRQSGVEVVHRMFAAAGMTVRIRSACADYDQAVLVVDMKDADIHRMLDARIGINIYPDYRCRVLLATPERTAGYSTVIHEYLRPADLRADSVTGYIFGCNPASWRGAHHAYILYEPLRHRAVIMVDIPFNTAMMGYG